MQPGGIISPGAPPEQQPAEPQAPSDTPAPPQPDQSLPEPEKPETPEAPEPASGWQFHPEEDTSPGQASAPRHAAAVNWTASEYVAHDKNASWYLLVVIATAGIAAVVYLLTREWISFSVVLIIGISFAAFGARKPRTLEFAVDHSGVHIGQKLYPYSMFKSFSIIEEDAIRSILLMPLHRFNLPISVYYDPADEDEIVDALGSYLPHENRQPAAVDNFMRKIRF
ncbi:MAG: hypothetical protein ACRD4B_02175 [Acidobacteriota bacterium]